MKTINTTIFALSLLVLGTGSICRFSYGASMSSDEIQYQIQEELAWGILKHDVQLVRKALVQGANPYTLQKTNAFRQEMSKYRRSATLALSDEKVVHPYSFINYESEASFAVIEILLQHGVSVDEAIETEFYFRKGATFRQHLMEEKIMSEEFLMRVEQGAITKLKPSVVREKLSWINETLTLIDTYQSNAE